MQQPELLLLLLVLPVALIAWFVTRRQKRRALNQKLKDSWGSAARLRRVDPDNLPHIAEYWRLIAQQQARSLVDDITWNDLDMDALFTRINQCQSNAGEAVLYAMLRDTGVNQAVLDRRERWMAAFTAEEAGRMRVQKHLRRLGFDHHHNAHAFMARPDSKSPQRPWLYLLLGSLPLVFIGLGFVHPAFLLGLGLSFAVNLFVFYKTQAQWAPEVRAVRHLALVLRTAAQVTKHPLPGLEDGLSELAALGRSLRPIKRWSAAFAVTGDGLLEALTDYLRIAFMLDMIALTRLSAFITRHQQEVQALYRLLGEVDACIALASLRLSLPAACAPVFHEERAVHASGLVHPLVKAPVPNSVAWTRNALITGSNASGKSTFIKALALSAICGQSLGICFSDAFAMPQAQVMSSMAVKDQVLSGESYFIVEIKSLRRILEAIHEERLVLCFIDEILRGTNTVERIASSASLLRYLRSQPALCMAATHDIELTQLLRDFQQFHFREEMTKAGMTFPYRLLTGPSTTRNAIRLLSQMDFPQEVVQSADTLAAGFTASGTWDQRPDKHIKET